ncbi:NACHT domain-containing NTPase [Geobacter sp. AOG2]|uniref:NACHT domain-containing protein n=1 Tax=Geobacter sp. AOG2 TaxID=1566347 RepID=UPI001CC63821|nr:NACHT domain-containing protein [Geobacter sp. AOG2]GFE59561.1 hypothetical protein AOG2_01490 [Geobacter sp. AOG2]
MTVTETEQKLLVKIQSLNENDFTRDVLMPLYRSSGYEKVDFYGGPYENGKDLICWRRDSWEDVELVVVQAKCYEPSGRASDDKSFIEIVRQILQAAETPIPHLDGNQYKPISIEIVTPFVVDTRALETAFYTQTAIRNYKIKVVDGIYVIKNLRKHIPKLVMKLIGSGPMVNDIMTRSLNNIDLRNALNVYQLKELDDVYCDLDFTVGNITTKLLLSFKLKPSNIVVTYTEERWQHFKCFCEELKHEMGIDILVEKIKDIEKRYNRDILAINKAVTKVNKLKNALDEIGVSNVINSITDLVADEENDCIQSIAYRMKEITSNYYRIGSKNLDDYIEYTNQIDDEIYELKKITKKIVGTKLLNYLAFYDKTLKKSKKIENELSDMQRKVNDVRYIATINGPSLCSAIADNQKHLKEEVSNLLKNERTPSKVLEFITKCELILKNTEKLLNYEYLSEAAGLSSDMRFVSIDKLDRINFSVHEIFDSGQDFVIFGEAGAGKTTTLQSYARKTIETSRKEVVFYIPLARSFYRLEIINPTEFNYVEFLYKAIIKHLMSQEIVIDITTIRDIADNKSTLFIFDGIDEIIDKIPWIINAIISFKQQNPKIQILTSSRLSGNYINNIPFVGLTLLPFDDEQREAFFRSWFNDPQKLQAVVNHLHNTPDLNDIVRNPLLATILCVIAEYDIPLPESEIRLYEERMSLLLGSYDKEKLSNRLKSHYRDLIKVASKIAFILHRKEARYSGKDEIVEKMCDFYQSSIAPDKIALAVNELIDPCNILMPMTDDGQYGFGHLRFQEYLVACELKENRSIKLLDYLDKTFWRGAFILLSKMSDDIHHLVDELVNRGALARYTETIELMLKARPQSEQASLMELVQMNTGLDHRGSSL